MDSTKRNGSQKAEGMQQLVYDQKSGSSSFVSSCFRRPKPSAIYHWWKISNNVLMFPPNIMRGKKMTELHDSNTCKEYKHVS